MVHTDESSSDSTADSRSIDDDMEKRQLKREVKELREEVRRLKDEVRKKTSTSGKSAT